MNPFCLLIRLFLLILLILSVSACGNGSTSSGQSSVTGVAAAGAPITGQVYLKDINGKTAGPVDTDVNGNFFFNVAGLTPPFILKIEGQAGGYPYTLYSVATKAGNAHINPFSTIVLATATGLDPEQIFNNPSATGIDDAKIQLGVSKVTALLRPLLDFYEITEFDPITSDYVASPENKLDTVLDVVSILVENGSFYVTNRLTDTLIASGSIADISTVALNMAVAPDKSALTDIQELSVRLAELCDVMNKGNRLTTQDLEDFFVPDPDYGTSSGLTRTEDINSIVSIFGPNGTNSNGRLASIKNIRLVWDYTSSYSGHSVNKVYLLNYDFIFENGVVVQGSDVTFAKVLADGQLKWKFIGDYSGEFIGKGYIGNNYGGVLIGYTGNNYGVISTMTKLDNLDTLYIEALELWICGLSGNTDNCTITFTRNVAGAGVIARSKQLRSDLYQ